jgi:hypothetical protein
MRTCRAGRHPTSRMPGSHRSHISRSEARHAAARSYPQLRRTISRRDRPVLRLHREQFPVSVPSHADAHPRHVIRDIERMFPLAGLHSAIARRLRLIRTRPNAEPPAIGRRPSRILLQLLLDCVRLRRRRHPAGNRPGPGRLIASGETEKNRRENDQRSFHAVIVNPPRPM